MAGQILISHLSSSGEHCSARQPLPHTACPRRAEFSRRSTVWTNTDDYARRFAVALCTTVSTAPPARRYRAAPKPGIRFPNQSSMVVKYSGANRFKDGISALLPTVASHW
jgi:hypothetical protein